MTGAPTPETAQAAADTVTELLDKLPEGVTATVVLCVGDLDGFQTAIAGNTPAPLLRVVLRRALERLEKLQ